QLASPCGKFLLSWTDLHYLRIVGKKGRIPAWFIYLKENVLISSVSSFFKINYVIKFSFTLVSPPLLDNSVPDGQYRPLWALSWDRITQALLVGRVCVTYSKKDFAIMSHWLPTSDVDSASFRPCPGCSLHVLKYASLSHIKRCCTSESCFFTAPLADTIAYPSKNAKVFATGRPIILSSSLRYATSLALSYFNRPPLILNNYDSTDHFSDNIDMSLPTSTKTIFTDGSFIASIPDSSPSMSYAWLTLDDDNLILESFSDIIPNTYPSALRSELAALLSAINALAPNSSVTINTDCASLISFWHEYICKPFIPKLLRQPNHLLWLSIKHLVDSRNLTITLCKVPAHDDCPYNNQVDLLAKRSFSSSQPSTPPIGFLRVPCIISFNNLPIDDNIRHFLKSIYDAMNLLKFSSLLRFSQLGPPDLFDWEIIYYWISCNNDFASHKNGQKGFLTFRLKILLDALPTLTLLQKRKPSSYPSNWLCPLCNTAPEDLNHLWTCPYIIPNASPRVTFQRHMTTFRNDCILHITDGLSLPDSFITDFSALDCWDFIMPSSSCLWLTRGLFPTDLIKFLNNFLPKNKILTILSPLLFQFHEQIYTDIWLPRNVFFHLWLESQTPISTPSPSSTLPTTPGFLDFMDILFYNSRWILDFTFGFSALLNSSTS
ncbi:hypothetical protein RhiirA4_485873, partial [Rhizophagus irregularis]